MDVSWHWFFFHCAYLTPFKPDGTFSIGWMPYQRLRGMSTFGDFLERLLLTYLHHNFVLKAWKLTALFRIFRVYSWAKKNGINNVWHIRMIFTTQQVPITPEYFVWYVRILCFSLCFEILSLKLLFFLLGIRVISNGLKISFQADRSF